MTELLAVPLKRGSDVELVKPLLNVVASASGGVGESHAEAVAELARLRQAAVFRAQDAAAVGPAALDDLYAYYDQLVLLEQKVPPQELQVPFKWKDAFNRRNLFGGRLSLTLPSLAFERVCVLFNIGAAQTAIAAAAPRDSEDDLKAAAKLLQSASGVFSALRVQVPLAVHGEPTPDLRADTLQALAALALAQAQEVIALKCIKDEMKESMVAKVCAAADDLYVDALRLMDKEGPSALWDRDWTSCVSSKQYLFRGLSQYYSSLVCRGNKEVGEEIARLRAAGELLKDGPMPDVTAKCARRLAEAVRDNDFIYHERVPDEGQLGPVPRAAVARAAPPPARWLPHARELFAALVPLGVGAALAAAAARRGEAVGAAVGALREGGQLLAAALASLGLPGAAEPAPPGRLPPSLAGAAEGVQRGGGLPALQARLRELPELLQRNRDILSEAERLLREEAAADEALRAQFGARWTRTDSARLTGAFRANADKYSQIIDNAVRADDIVQQKLAQHKEGIELLSLGPEEAGRGLPAGGGGEGAALRELRDLMRQADELKAERARLEEEIKAVNVETSLREKFTSLAAGGGGGGGGAEFAALTGSALEEALGPLRARAAALDARQDALLEAVRRAHGAAAGQGGQAARREDALARLTAAADAYKDLTANLEEGIKFYNDLTQLLVAFQNKVSDFCFARKTEKDELLKDLTAEAARVPAAEPAVARRDAPAAPSPSPAPPAPPAPSPAPHAALPYPMQPQGMPLPYAAGAGYLYGLPPMPALYNPYATLPYPSAGTARAPPQYAQYPQYPQYPQHPQQPQQPGYNPYPQQ